jgi:hypothetical protein
MPPRLRSAAPAAEAAQPPPQQRVTSLLDLSDELLGEILERCVTSSTAQRRRPAPLRCLSVARSDIKPDRAAA